MADLLPMTTEDYQQLFELSMSPDPAVRRQASEIAKTLTPEEGRAFYDHQKQANAPPSKTTSVLGIPITVVGDRSRVDSNVIGDDRGSGLAPEDFALIGQGIGAVRGAASAAADAGTGVTRAVAGAAAKFGAPAVKFHIAHSMLRTAGLPDPYASWAAAVFTGGTQGKGAAAEAEAAGPRLRSKEAVAASAAEHPLATGTPMKAADALAQLQEVPVEQRAAVLRARAQAIAAQRAAPAPTPAPVEAAPMTPPEPPTAPVPLQEPVPAPTPPPTPAAAPAAPPVESAPPPVPGVKRFTDPDWSRSAQAMRSELGIQARRLGMKGEQFLSEGEAQSGLRRMKKGITPDVAAREIQQKRLDKALSSPPPSSLPPDAQQVFEALVAKGKTEAEAMEAVQQQMALRERFGSLGEMATGGK